MNTALQLARTDADAVTTSPAFSNYDTYFKIVEPKDLSVAKVEELRKTHNCDLAIIFDVSPQGEARIIAQQLKGTKTLIIDHHNAFAPVQEQPGNEATAAELAMATLQALERAGMLKGEDGRPLKVLAVTHSMNVDPDQFITRFIIESFGKPELRSSLLSDPGSVECLINAARFGDISFFGGIDPATIKLENALPEVKLALAMFQMINDEKAQLVTEARLQTALINLNYKSYGELLVKNGEIDNWSGDAGKKRINDDLDRAASLHPVDRAGAALKFLREQLGEKFLALDKVFGPLINGDLHDAVLSVLLPSQIREVFLGKKTSDGFGAEHGPLWNPYSINDISKRIANEIPSLLSNNALEERLGRRYLKILSDVKKFATSRTKSQSISETMQIDITDASDGRLDRERDVHFTKKKPGQKIEDWLRNASAAFGDNWIHILDKGKGSFVISLRAPRDGETRPHINLSHPDLLAALEAAELKAAQAAKEKPASFLTKPNLILPFQATHLSMNDVVDLLVKHAGDITATPNDSNRRITRTYVDEQGVHRELTGIEHLLFPDPKLRPSNN